jgi:N4-gp56 family major capsid protein
MADAFNTTATSGLDQTAFNLAVDTALRAALPFGEIATVRPTRQAHPGAAVTFRFINDLAIASTALNESVDVDAVAITDTPLTLTLQEFGNAVIETAKLAATSYVPFDPIMSDQIARNAALSMDEIALIPLRGATNVIYSGQTTAGARNRVIPTNVLTPDSIRLAVARLQAANVETFNGFYVAFIHPDAVYDFQGDTGATGWLTPANYSAAERRWSGEIGAFQGVRFISATRAPVFADAGSSTTLTDVYATIVMGRDALAKAYSMGGGYRENPVVVRTPVTDKLQRFTGLGWKWFGAYGVYRQAALWRIEHASSIGTNA